MQTRVLSRVILISFLIIIFVIFFTSTEKNRTPLNLIIISIDTLRTDHMGVYGYTKNTTPNIDKWAKNAIVFTNATTVVPMTYPSFSALFTGKDPFQTRIVDNRPLPISPNTKTLAQILKDNGYNTSSFTVLHPDDTSFDQGFEYTSRYTFKYVYFKDKIERYKETDRTGYEQQVAKAIDWMKSNKQKKIFLWIHLFDPHTPYFPPEDLRCKFNQKYCKHVADKTLDELDEKRAQYQMCQESDVPRDTIELMKTLYDGEIANSDRLAGLILDELRQLELDKNTVVVLYGDHGEGFDHNYYFNHREVLYNSAIHIPLIIKHPSLRNQIISHRLIQNTDILPTIVDLLGIKLDIPQIDGISFSDEFSTNILTRFKTRKKRVFAYSVNSTWTKFSITDGHYKYIYSLPDSCLLENQTEELYNLESNPSESKNLVHSEIQITKHLRQKLLNHLSIYNLPKHNLSSSSMPQNDTLENHQNKLENLKSLNY